MKMKMKMKMNPVGCLVFLVVMIGLLSKVCAQGAADFVRASDSPPVQDSENTNLKLPTLGGRQYWSDVRIVGGWKIQRHAATRHHRLIDNHGTRHAWGDLEQCETCLKEHELAHRVVPESGKVVILLHGLMRSSDSMEKLDKFLLERGEFQILNFAYASSLAPIEVHAADLKSVIEGLGDDVTEINFVAHSMGNIVVRYYLQELNVANPSRKLPFKRMVMLAPPNQGSRSARNLATATKLFEKVAGPSGLELGTGWEQLAPKLATPPFEFAIIIGGKTASDDHEAQIFGMPTGLRSLDPASFRPNDFMVSVEEAKLDGAKDFLVGPFFHWNIKYQPQAMQQTLNFLQHGRFEREEQYERGELGKPLRDVSQGK